MNYCFTPALQMSNTLQSSSVSPRQVRSCWEQRHRGKLRLEVFVNQKLFSAECFGIIYGFDLSAA